MVGVQSERNCSTGTGSCYARTTDVRNYRLGKYWAAATTGVLATRLSNAHPGVVGLGPGVSDSLPNSRTRAHLNSPPPSIKNKPVNSDSDSPMIHLYDLREHRTQQATTSAKQSSYLFSASPTVEPIHIAYTPNMALLSAPRWSPSRRPWGRRRRWEVGAELGLCCSDVEDG
jgi:hypothetical protein